MSKQQQKPLQLTKNQQQIAEKLRPIFSWNEFQDPALAIGFIDSVAILVELVETNAKPEEIHNIMQIIWNYYLKLKETNNE